jgi:hypothetical protein
MTIPAHWATPVRVALKETFGVEAADSITPVSGACPARRCCGSGWGANPTC